MNKITAPIKSRLICLLHEEVELVAAKYGNYFNTVNCKEYTAEYLVVSFIKEIINRGNYCKERFDIADVVAISLLPHTPEDVIETIVNSLIIDLAGLRTLVMSFIGTNNWIMHFLKEGSNQVTIEKSIDFRIYDWSVENNKPL